MGKEYLSESAMFTCPLGMRFKAVETVNSKLKFKGQKLLTKMAKLIPNQSPIPCSFLPPTPAGAPTPCPCIASPLVDNVIHRSMANLLTVNAKSTCAAGQFIKPQRSGTNNHVVTGSAISAQVASINFPKNDTPKQSVKTESVQNQSIQTQSDQKFQSNQSITSDELSTSKDINSINFEKNIASPAKSETLSKSDKSLEIRAGMLCSCSKNRSECENCAYRLDNESATVNNNSNILRQNYNSTKPHADPYDQYFDDEVEILGNSKPNRWRYAAHHLIPGNQVFKQNIELVRLAQFCGYDINSATNCIMLVGYPEDYPDIERMKSVKAYDVMSEGRIQWHVGGHSYTFTDEEKSMICKQIGIRNKIKLTPADIKNYAELVREEIEKLVRRLTSKKDRQIVCYADQRVKKQFCDKLDRISRKIKSKLSAFTDVGKPHHSFPFYVSKEAYRYTYALPRTGKVITVLRDKSNLTLAKYRLEHFTDAIAEKDKNLSIKLKSEKVFDLSIDGWQNDCIVFCDNVIFFVYLNDTPRNILPFEVDIEHQFPIDPQNTGMNSQQFLEDHDTEILVWLRDNPNYGYVSPIMMVKKRFSEFNSD